jgi:biopolymer transport protein ExbD
MSSGEESEAGGIVTGINVTPLVDIMLVFLVIFMVTSHFVAESAIKVNLPADATTETSTKVALTVSLDAIGKIWLMETEMDINGLIANLDREAKMNPGVRVTLAADGDLEYERVISVLDAIKQAGVVRVSLAAERDN